MNKMEMIPTSLVLTLAGITFCTMPAVRAAETDPKIAEITKTA